MCALQRKREAEALQREATFQQLFSEVLGGLGQDGEGVLSEVQEVLQYADAAQQARKEALYQQWQSQVFEPMQVSSADRWLHAWWCSVHGRGLNLH